MSANPSAGRWNRVVESASFGFIFGSLFPLVATAIALLSNDIEPSWSAVWALHRAEPLLQLIDAVPVLLLLTFTIVGRGRVELDALIEGLEVRVAQRTAVLDEANKSVEKQAQSRGRLLARVSDSIVERIDRIVNASRDDRGPWAWESVMDIAMRLRDLSQFEAGEVWQSSGTFEPQALVDGVRTYLDNSRAIESVVEVTLDPGVPASVVGNQGLTEAALKVAVQLTAEFATDAKTTVAILWQRGAPGSTDRLRMECINAEARDVDAGISRVMSRDLRKEGDMDAVRELLAVTLRTYVEALDAELAMKTSPDDGTMISLSVPMVAGQTPDTD